MYLKSFFHPLIILFESSSDDRWIIGRLPRRRRFQKVQKSILASLLCFYSMGSRIESRRENGRWRKMETDEDKAARRKEVNANSWIQLYVLYDCACGLCKNWRRAARSLHFIPHAVTAVHVNIQLCVKIDNFVWSILQMILKTICKFWEDFALLQVQYYADNVY